MGGDGSRPDDGRFIRVTHVQLRAFEELLRQGRVSPYALWVWLAIRSYEGRDKDGRPGAETWPAMATIAEKHGRHRSRVLAAVEQLVAVGGLQRFRDRHFGPNHYVARCPIAPARGDTDYQDAKTVLGDTDDQDAKTVLDSKQVALPLLEQVALPLVEQVAETRPKVDGTDLEPDDLERSKAGAPAGAAPARPVGKSKRQPTKATSCSERPSRFVAPTLQQVIPFMVRNGGSQDDAELFQYTFESNGWRVGSGAGKPMQSWEAAARAWLIRERKYSRDVRAGGGGNGDLLSRLAQYADPPEVSQGEEGGSGLAAQRVEPTPSTVRTETRRAVQGAVSGNGAAPAPATTPAPSSDPGQPKGEAPLARSEEGRARLQNYAVSIGVEAGAAAGIVAQFLASAPGDARADTVLQVRLWRWWDGQRGPS
jgi:hypothetical protein